ncbi:MAG: hypothetical protein BIFFINMI_02797 [Phycisphaerae bacterium]|nr:hypothetical protein [Phycisphaerae bacterium]
MLGASSQLPYKAGIPKRAVKVISKTVAIASFVILLALVAVNISAASSSVGIFVAGIIALLLSWLGRWLIYELQLLRTGAFSAEACALAWHHVFTACCPE